MFISDNSDSVSDSDEETYKRHVNNKSTDNVKENEERLEKDRMNIKKQGERSYVFSNIEITDGKLIIRDINIPGLYIRKMQKKIPKADSQNECKYDNFHACYFCGIIVLHISEQLKTRKTRKLLKEVIHSDNDFTALRKLGDNRHNSAYIDKEKGKIILARRPKEQFDISKYRHCILGGEWVCLNGIKYHFQSCKQKHNMTEQNRDFY